MTTVPRSLLTAGCALSVALLALACSGNALTGGSSSQSKSDGAGDADGDADAGDAGEDDGTATIPQEVSGSFLTCAVADGFTPTDPAHSGYGCAFHDKDDERIDVEVTDPLMQLRINGGAKQETETAVAPATSPWHIHFAIPTAVKDSVTSLSLTATVNGKAMLFGIGAVSTGKWSVLIDPNGGFGDEAVYTGATPAGFDHVIFVTSDAFKSGGNIANHDGFSSVADADALCTYVSERMQGLHGDVKWKALLSAGTGLAGRGFTLSGRVINMQGQTLMSETSGPLPMTAMLRAVGYDELGNSVGSVATWGGSLADGSHGKDCNSWQSASGSVQANTGRAISPGHWFAGDVRACDQSASLLCMSFPE